MSYKTINIAKQDHGIIGESTTFSMQLHAGEDYKVDCRMPIEKKVGQLNAPLGAFKGTVTIGAVKAREFVSADANDRATAFSYILRQFNKNFVNRDEDIIIE